MKRLFPISLILCVVLILTACGFNQLFSSTPCEHVFGGWIVERPATCKEDGLRTRTCVYCSYIEQIRIDKFNTHTEVIDPAILATCERTGLSEGKHCSVCNKVLLSQQETPCVAHTYDDEHDESCNVCNHIRDTQCVHNETEIMEGRAATCTKIGLTAGSKCKTCGEILVNQTVLSVIDHSAGGWIVDKEATKAEDGRKRTECTICGQLIKEEIIPATGSVGLEFTLNEDGKSYRVSGIGTCRDNDIVIPAKHDDLPVTTIGNNAFSNCDSLNSVTIGNSATTIGVRAFSNCASLTSVTIGDSVTTIGVLAFGYCEKLTSVTIGNSVTTIGDSAFSNCTSLTSVTIPDSVTTIGNNAFSGCDGLTSITIPDSVTTIGDFAFVGCLKLTSVTIPDSVTVIGKEAFGRCNILNGVWVDKDNPAYSNDEYGVLFSKDKTVLCQVPGALAGAYIIPDSVTTIGYSAFSNCDKLTSVTIPDSVTAIGSSAFSGCDGLTSITIPDSVTTIGEHAFNYCLNLTSVTIGNSVTTIGMYAFSVCLKLTNVTIGNSVTTIGVRAFYNCASLTSVTIPDSLTTIGESAFASCNKLTSVTIGNSVTTIGYYAFIECEKLTDITFKGTMEQWNNIDFGDEWKNGIPAKKVTCSNGSVSLK